jgi:N utilization substance protein B
MRRQGRICALQILYQLDLHKQLPIGGAVPVDAAAVEAAMQLYWESFDPVEAGAQRFTKRLVEGLAGALQTVDAALTQAAHHWKLERMDRVDRNLLRLAAYEMLCCSDIPRSASLNEAVELAKCFSGAQAAAFVNGVLDHVEAVTPEPQHEVEVDVVQQQVRRHA